MTYSSIASSTSIQDSSPSSCWQGSSITSRRLSTTLIKSVRRRYTPTGSSFKESEVDYQLHKNDNLKTQNAQELSDDCTRTTIEKPERPGRIPRNTTETRTDIGTQNVFTDSSHKQENLVTQLFMAPQSSSMAPSRKKERNNSIHFNASRESPSTISKLLESANIRCILFAIRNYLDDLQQGNLLLEYREQRNFLP